MRLMAAVFLALTAMVLAFQVALIAGVPWGHLTQGGQYAGALPLAGRVFAGVSIGVLALMGWIVAARAGLAAPEFPRWTIWVVVACLVVSVGLHLLTPSAAERALWLPVVGVKLACALRVARG